LDHETERKVLILAALHDAAESRTSDIPHDVKANYPEMQRILDKVEEDYYNEVWGDYKEEVYKPGDLCYNILKLADSYSVYQYCLNEKALGNVSDVINEITHNSIVRIQHYTDTINQMIKEGESKP
jgi:5'-deoxynucleotidase YfbR-like HD superfamily hydrolase